MEYPITFSLYHSVTDPPPPPVPFIMVVWGTIMSLMCLVNSFRGLVMYAIRVIHLSFRSF